jgi:hypothetical protein
LKIEKKLIGFREMHNNKSSIPVFSLWLAWLVLTAHLIIPHDHHLADSFSREDEKCHSSNSNTNHHGFPIHCHAFNGLASEKATKYVPEKKILNNDLPFGAITKNSTSDFLISQTSIFNVCEPFPDLYLLDLSQLRAPPSLV